jgi:hypothetical protein
MMKPVRTEFVDFSKPALRQVELNRRLARFGYLGAGAVFPRTTPAPWNASSSRGGCWQALSSHTSDVRGTAGVFLLALT